MATRDFSVNIVGLSNKLHHYDFDADNAFFDRYGGELITEGALKAHVELDKHETFIEAAFQIDGWVTLICDRSLEPFRHDIHTARKLLFKYGDADEEITDEMVMINRESERLELGHYIFEFTALDVPMKKLHPRFRDEAWDDEAEGKIIYRSDASSDDDDDEGEAGDPRWEILKKLK